LAGSTAVVPLLAALRIAPDSAVRTDPAQTRRRPPAGSSVVRNPTEITPNAEVEVLPLIFLATRAETPGEIGLLVAVSNASFGGRCTVSRSTYQPDGSNRKTRYAFHLRSSSWSGRLGCGHRLRRRRGRALRVGAVHKVTQHRAEGALLASARFLRASANEITLHGEAGGAMR
jgi:ribosomal protein L34